jgi:DNA-binding MarR family transcriptional regulator
MTPDEAEADSSQQPCPWDDLPEDGVGLSVNDFITTRVVLAAHALKRGITLQYAEQFGLSMSEWRMLSVLAHAGELPFAELVQRSATDKGQVSRTLGPMQERGLVQLRAQAGSKKVDCLITEAGRALYDQVMPLARRRQASMIRQLAPQERRAVYGAMKKLREWSGGLPGIEAE